MHILTLNGGSSSIKFSVHRAGATLERLLAGRVDRIGRADATLSVDAAGTGRADRRPIAAGDFKSAATALVTWLEAEAGFDSINAVGHRVVHGMGHSEPELVTPALIEELHRIEPFDPEHLPGEIQMMEILRQRHPRLSQVACFDTAFHNAMPRVARMLPIPRRYEAGGVRRYGAHAVARLGFIRRAQDVGFTLDEVKTLLKLGETPNCRGARTLAAQKLEVVQTRLS